MPEFMEQFDKFYLVIKDMCDKIKNKRVTLIKCDKTVNKRQSFNKLHPQIKKYAAEYGLEPEGEYDSFTIVGKIKKYICKDKSLYIPETRTQLDAEGNVIEGKKEQSLILNSRVDIDKSEVLKGTFGELIEIMKKSDSQNYRDAANNCRLSNIQTFCSILQSNMRRAEEKKKDEKKDEEKIQLKKSDKTQARENEK